MKFLKDLKENTGYYYVDEEMNLNDLVLMLAFVFITFAVIVVRIIESFKDSYITELIIGLVYIGLSIPFIAHFVIKISKMLAFRFKRRKFISNGKCCRARIVDSVKGKCIFKDSTSGIEKFSYYPVAELYSDDKIYRITSVSALNNRAETALADNNVTLVVYGDDFILTEFNPAASFRNSIEYNSSQNKMVYEKTNELISKVALTAITGVTVINVIYLIIRIGIQLFFK